MENDERRKKDNKTSIRNRPVLLVGGTVEKWFHEKLVYIEKKMLLYWLALECGRRKKTFEIFRISAKGNWRGKVEFQTHINIFFLV